MRSHRRLILFLGITLIAVTGAIYGSPELLRRVAVARLQAITHRPVTIDSVRFNLAQQGLTVRGLRIAEPGGGGVFADVGQLELQLRLASLLGGHLWIRE